MPDIGVFHPQIVHFVIVGLFLGVGLRVLSLLGKPAWISPAATLLLLVGTAASVVAVQSGTDAHGAAERIPGARETVQHHEEHGEQTRNIFLVVAALELVALGFLEKKPGKWIHAASALIGVYGGFNLYETAEHGGDIVYEHAGGVGTRSGDPADVTRLLLAGLYQQAQLDRRSEHPEDAARLIEEMARRYPSDAGVQLLAAESQLRDRHDAAAALSALDALTIPQDDARTRSRVNSLRVDALTAAGMRDSAIAILKGMVAASPQNTRLADRLAELERAAAAPAPQP